MKPKSRVKEQQPTTTKWKPLHLNWQRSRQTNDNGQEHIKVPTLSQTNEKQLYGHNKLLEPLTRTHMHTITPTKHFYKAVLINLQFWAIKGGSHVKPKLHMCAEWARCDLRQ